MIRARHRRGLVKTDFFVMVCDNSLYLCSPLSFVLRLTLTLTIFE